MDGVIEKRLQSFQRGLWFMGGLTLALTGTFLAGDLRSGAPSFPYGWVVLWLLSLIGCVPLGIVLLIGPSWRALLSWNCRRLHFCCSIARSLERTSTGTFWSRILL